MGEFRELFERVTDSRAKAMAKEREAIAKEAAKKVAKAIEQGGCGITANVERVEEGALVEVTKKAIRLELDN